jgi:hypothetical protein
MNKLTAVAASLALVLVTGVASADTVVCRATEKGSDVVIAEADGPSLTQATLELHKKVKASAFCAAHKGEKLELLNHSNATVAGHPNPPSKLLVTCPK